MKDLNYMEFNSNLFLLPQAEVDKYGEMNLVYGSLTTKGLETMIQTLTPLIDSESIEGLDLGCGDGELIYHLQTLLSGSTWYGVEIAESRVNKQKRPVFIWCGDFLEESLRNYNVLHADNLCLEESVAEKLEEKICREFSGIYITYRLPVHLPLLKKAIHLCSVPTETTWTTHTIHYYHVYV
jgi:hypothetical protein